MSFGDEGSPLDARGRRDVAALGCRFTDVVSGPGRAVIETAELLAVTHLVDDELRSIDIGSWIGRTPEDVGPEALGGWFVDPASTPHGGESVVAFVDRVQRCLRRLADGPVRTAVVAKPVVQAAVALHRGVGAGGFFGVDIPPASTWTVDIPIVG